MKNVSFVLLGLLVSISVGLTAQERINAEELKEVSLERKVVTIVSGDGKKLDWKVIEYNGESVLFQRQEDLQLFRFKLTALALQSQRMIRDDYMTSDYNVPKLPRPLNEATIKKLARYADNLVLEKLRS